MDDLVLRDATAADAALLVGVLHAAFEEYRGRLDPPSGVHGETVATVRQNLTRACAVLALQGEAVAGCVFCEPQADHLYLSRLAVLPAYRRAGVGRALVAAVEQRAPALHLLRVRLGVRLALTELRAAYERMGYRPIEYHAHPGYPAPTYVVLEKEVAR
jgi:ribosomal protein S18 acetylase RimI-like enzyme